MLKCWPANRESAADVSASPCATFLLAGVSPGVSPASESFPPAALFASLWDDHSGEFWPFFRGNELAWQ
jgi:hypothetical protein